MAGLKVKIGADASQFERTMRGVRKEVRGVKNSIMGIGGAVGAVWAANKAFEALKTTARGAYEFIKDASNEASEVESLAVQFEVLLGSTEAAEERMRKITKFAATTPFEIKELASTSKLLENLTDGFLATGKGLRMVGDATAIAGVPLQEMATNVGRVFKGLTTGADSTEAMKRLVELGVVSFEVKEEWRNLTEQIRKGKAEGMSSADAMAALSAAMGKTEGAMQRLAETTAGKKSMVKDAMDQIKVAFGTGFNDGLKSALDAATNFIPQFQGKMEEAGKTIGTAIARAVEGDSDDLKAVGQLLGSYIAQGIEKTITSALRLFLDKGTGIGGILSALGVDTSFGALKTQREIDDEYSQTRSSITQGLRISQQDQDIFKQKAFQKVVDGNIIRQTYRLQSPDAANPSPFTDAQGNRIVLLAEEIVGLLTPEPGT